MRRRLRRSLTFANVCSFLALVVALGTGGAYAADTVFSEDIADGEVKTPDIAPLAVTNPKIQQGAVTSGKIANGQVTNVDLAADAVDGAKIAASAVGADDIAAGAVGQSEIATDGVGATEVANDSIDEGEIETAGVFAEEIAAGAVGSSEIAGNAITGSKVANGGLTMSDVKGADNSGTITINDGSVASGRCIDVALNVPGAEVGDAVVFSTRGDMPPGVLITGWRVAVNNQATVKICNLTGGTFPQLSSVPIRLFTID